MSTYGPSPSLLDMVDVLTVAGTAILALTAALVVVMLLGRRRSDATLAGTRARLEQLQDEVWELKETAVARERAEAASEAKSRFLATVSHEIRTPLSGILGMAELIASGPLDGEQHAYVDAIKTSGRALTSLLDEILDFSKIEAGRVDLVESTVDLEALIEGVVELLVPRAHGKGVEIAAYLSADVPREIVSDEARLRQILMNLAGNAVKFTDAGGVGVHVTRADAGTLRFAVEDTGIGIAPDRQSAIFREFEQADTSSTRSHGGTGLGLAISRRLVEYMGGEITLRSAPDQGSEFAFTMPFGQPPTTRRHEPDLVAMQGRRALIVAGSVYEAPYLAATLEDVGTSVARAPTADAAVALLQAAPAPDVVIVDCALGEATLVAVSAAARSAGTDKILILFSPFERRAIAREALGDYDGWLVKPVRARSLFERLAGASGAPPDSSENALAAPPPPPRRGLRILLAEDDPINAMIALAFLDRLDAVAVHVRDGKAALEALDAGINGARERFDAAVMDIRMPGLDGREVARRVRDAEARAGARATRLVALTANALAEDREACLAAGFDVFLTKPVDVRALGDAIDDRTPSVPGMPRSAQVVA